MSLPARAGARTRPSGHSTAKIAAAVIRPNRSHSAMAALHHERKSAAMRKIKAGRLCRKSAPCGLLLAFGRNVGGAREQAGVFGPEQPGAKADRRIDLRLAQRPFRLSRGAQALEEDLSAAGEIALTLGLQ